MIPRTSVPTFTSHSERSVIGLIRLSALLILVTAACSSPHPALHVAGPTGDRICGDSTLFVHMIGNSWLADEGMFLAPDSIHWVRSTSAGDLRLAAAIDQRLVMREAVTRYWPAEDSLSKGRPVIIVGRLETRGDSAMFAVGDKAAHVQRGPIARDAAVMLALSVAFDEILIRRARMTGRDSVDIPTYFLGNDGFAPTAHVRFTHPDSARIRFGKDDIVADMAVDSVGRILSGSYQSRGDDVVTVQRQRCSK